MTINLKVQYHKNSFKVCATVANTPKRNREDIRKELINPDPATWDKNKQMFIVSTGNSKAAEEAICNNAKIKVILARYQNILDLFPDIQTGAELFARYKESLNIEACKTLTFGDWIEREFLQMRKQETSSNWECYRALLNSLKREAEYALSIRRKPIMNTSIKEINNTHFKNYCMFLKDQRNGSNYASLCRRFQTLYNRANNKLELKKDKLHFDWMQYLPKEEALTAEEIIQGGNSKALDITDYERFINCDLSTVSLGNYKPDFFKRLYMDAAVLMYELTIRPIDLINLRWGENIAYNSKNERYELVYIPKKKENSSTKNRKKQVYRSISDKALEIINSYKGVSTSEFVLPFGLNMNDWDLSDPDDCRRRKSSINSVCSQINKFLKKVAKTLDIKSTITLYTFRHTALTHLIVEGGNIFEIAAEAGTSVAMLEKTYYNHMPNNDKKKNQLTR